MNKLKSKTPFTVKKEENICSVCNKHSLRPRSFLLDGVVTHFCYKCVKSVPRGPLASDSENPELFCCKDCREIFSSLRALQFHAKTQHAEDKPEFPCLLCVDKSYTTKFGLKHHYRKHHEGSNITLPATHSDDTTFSSETEIENYFKESEENPLQLITPKQQPQSSPSNSSSNLFLANPHKRRASHDLTGWGNTSDSGQVSAVDNSQPLTEIQTWCSALAMTLAKMPPVDQIEMKMAIGNMVGKRELEILKRNDHT